ncbi:DUF4190 domain-containing protein [Glycomyces sp. YM15]|uniref:DUF4190 domain-containing protein n=1 Tax=Glycomyces sp. YM15 TaxID=2800446 RepID=UPI001966B9B2|nr:DUF4190 domain-containing protein [Glycomyces sp. YM15]
MTYPPPPPDQSGQGGFQYDPYGSQPGSQPQNPSQPQQPGYGPAPQQPGYGPAPQLPPQAPGYPPAYGAPGYGPQLPKGMAIGSMVTGIISVAGLCIPYINFASLILGIIAAILGGVALKKINRGEAAGKGQAITGLVLGIIVCALAAIGIIMFFAVGATMLGTGAATTSY